MRVVNGGATNRWHQRPSSQFDGQPDIILQGASLVTARVCLGRNGLCQNRRGDKLWRIDWARVPAIEPMAYVSAPLPTVPRTTIMANINAGLIDSYEFAARHQGPLCEFEIFPFAHVRKATQLERHVPLVCQRAKEQSLLFSSVLEKCPIRQLTEIRVRQGRQLSPTLCDRLQLQAYTPRWVQIVVVPMYYEFSLRCPQSFIPFLADGHLLLQAHQLYRQALPREEFAAMLLPQLRPQR
mmetsp:Transcript_41036/g.104349  ORF Transcript_41036/g.104349 Transcript_41036/m.104349 type:complete len:239 (+) Transcript_41036:320-1036(+)